MVSSFFSLRIKNSGIINTNTQGAVAQISGVENKLILHNHNSITIIQEGRRNITKAISGMGTIQIDEGKICFVTILT